MSIWFFHSRFAAPPDAIELDPLDSRVWDELLEHPEVVSLEDHGHKGTKNAAPAICGARFFEGSITRHKENVECVEALILDVDNTETEGGVPPAEVLDEALSKYRAIIYTSPSHTTQSPRWRIVLPLATPLAPKMCRSLVQHLSDTLVPDYPGCIDVDATGDPTRLGFIKATKHPEHYGFWFTEGDVYDWRGKTEILVEETWGPLVFGNIERSPLWTDRATALQQALRFYVTAGHEAIAEGEHRSLCLWNIAMSVIWEWAADDFDFVIAVLESVNQQFPEPKPHEVLVRKIEEAYERTIGSKRKHQKTGGYGFRREPSNAASEASIKHHARRLKHRHSPIQARLGDEMTRMINGHTLADEPNMWRNACTRVAHELAETFVNDTKEKLASFFDGSLKAMRATGNPVPELAEIESWIGTRLFGAKARRAEQMEKHDEDQKMVISYATNGARTTKYTREEIDTWMAPNGPGLTPRSWLVQCNRGTYVFLNGTYLGPYTEAEFDAQGYTDLAAAADFVPTKTFNNEKGTWTNIRLPELLQKHGTKGTTELDYTCESTYFRKEDRTLVLAGPPKNDLEPLFHSEVDEWFRVATGRDTPDNEKQRREEAATYAYEDDYDALCNWCACLPQLERICAALYLQGRKGVGKGLFADGSARIWKHGKIPLNVAAGRFNGQMIVSPYIHVDEGLPKGMSASVLLRRTLADTEHVFERKHIDSGKIKGCVRMLFTANNLNIFDEAADEKLQYEDTDALSDRFVHIRVRQEAADYLRSLGPRHRDFVNKNMLAEHILWLNEKRWAAIKERDLRFLVEGRNQNVSNVVATNSKATSEVCTVLAEAFADAFMTGRVQDTDWFVVRAGKLFVSTPGLRRQINLRNPAFRASEREIAQAVNSISSGTEYKRMVKALGKRTKMWRLREEALQAWCENTGTFDWEDVRQGLAKFDRAFEKDEV